MFSHLVNSSDGRFDEKLLAELLKLSNATPEKKAEATYAALVAFLRQNVVVSDSAELAIMD